MDSDKTKICSKCGLEKSIDEFYRYKSRDNTLYSWCKECHNKITPKYNNSIKRMGVCKVCSKEKIIQSRGMCKYCYSREWKQKHPERVKQYRIKHIKKYTENPTQVCSECGELKHIHGKRMCKKCYDEIWYQENPELKRQITNKWKKENPKRVRQHARISEFRKRARLKKINAKWPVSSKVFDIIFKVQFKDDSEYVCPYCLKEIGDSSSIDHIMPVSKWENLRVNLNYPYNLLFCCKSCNSKKSNKLLSVWIKELKRPKLKPLIKLAKEIENILLKSVVSNQNVKTAKKDLRKIKAIILKNVNYG